MPQEKKHQYSDDQMKGLILAIIGMIAPNATYQAADTVSDRILAVLNDENSVLAQLLNDYDSDTYAPSTETRQ